MYLLSSHNRQTRKCWKILNDAAKYCKLLTKHLLFHMFLLVVAQYSSHWFCHEDPPKLTASSFIFFTGMTLVVSEHCHYWRGRLEVLYEACLLLLVFILRLLTDLQPWNCTLHCVSWVGRSAFWIWAVCCGPLNPHTHAHTHQKHLIPDFCSNRPFISQSPLTREVMRQCWRPSQRPVWVRREYLHRGEDPR